MLSIIDKHIPCLAETLCAAGVEVIALEPEQITPEVVRHAQALFVRTRTRINKELLEGSEVEFVATATIGTDHMDAAYCQANHIEAVSAPGCNAQAVCDYVEEALNEVGGQSIGVVGYGHVGKRVAAMAKARGMQVVINDPPLGLTGDVRGCDVITFHTPLTKEGAYPTYHLCDAVFLSQCQPKAVIINAARGGVVDEQALLKSGHRFVVDTWENEPKIDPLVVGSEKAVLVSMHIAGYSLEGKINASQQCLDAFCQHFSFPSLIIDKNFVTLHAQTGDTSRGWLKRITNQLQQDPSQFEQLRKQYILR